MAALNKKTKNYWWFEDEMISSDHGQVVGDEIPSFDHGTCGKIKCSKCPGYAFLSL